MTVGQRKSMAHSALDSAEVQELKRLWWSLQNTLRVYPFLDDEENVTVLLSDLESMIETLSNPIKH